MTVAPRLTNARIEVLRGRLSDRDEAIVSSLDRIRMATTKQLQRLHFTSGTALSNARQARLSLDRLTALRIVTRLDRRIGGVEAGSAGFVYSLDIVGQSLAQRDALRRRKPWTPSVLFVGHTLAVAELYVQLVEADRTRSLDLLEFIAEPACWRPFLSRGGQRAWLKPDAYMRVGVGEFEDSYFAEVDRGTESPAALTRKLGLYRAYWTTGREQSSDGVFPRVLWLALDSKRCDVIVNVIGQQPRDSQQLFAVALLDQALQTILTGDAS